jgi:hypothetical protein
MMKILFGFYPICGEAIRFYLENTELIFQIKIFSKIIDEYYYSWH